MVSVTKVDDSKETSRTKLASEKFKKIEREFNKVVMKECLSMKPTGFSDCLLCSNAYGALKARQAKAPWRQGHSDEE